MSQPSPQAALRLQPAPNAETVELLFRVFGDVLIPLDELRERYWRNLNRQTFGAALAEGRIRLPVTLMDSSRKAPQFVHIHHAAALIDIQAYEADQRLAATALTAAEEQE